MEQKKPLIDLLHNFFLIFLGVWLIASPATFGYTSEVTLYKSDVICGFLLICCGWRARGTSRATFSPWLASLIGLWLQLAPLLFWTKVPAAYLNETFTGVLVILFSIIIPGIPNHTERSGREIPPGWSYNPSSWPQRIPVIALACFGWLAARYLTSYQMGFITTMWDPWFGDGTVRVITSSISEAFPIPDAGLGATAYALEALLGCKGGPARWRTMPWLVLSFGILVIPLGLISIILIILQPIAVHAWCALCLMIALSMLIMIMLTLDEVTASLQCIRQGKKWGMTWREVLWEGLPGEKMAFDTRTPPLTAPFHTLLAAAFRGCEFRWNLLCAALVGLSSMMLPAFLPMPRWLSDSDHILGALGITLSLISMAEVVRKARFGLGFFGLILFVAGLWNFGDLTLLLTHLLLGTLWIILCYPKGKGYKRQKRKRP